MELCWKNVEQARLLSWHPPQPQYDCHLVPMVSFCLPITHCVQLYPLPRSPHREEDGLSSLAHCWTNKIWRGTPRDSREAERMGSGSHAFAGCLVAGLCAFHVQGLPDWISTSGVWTREEGITWQLSSFPRNALVSFFCCIATNTSCYRTDCFKYIFQLLWVEGFCSPLAKATPFSSVPYTKQMRISAPWVLSKLRLSFVEFQFLDNYWVWSEETRVLLFNTRFWSKRKTLFTSFWTKHRVWFSSF